MPKHKKHPTLLYRGSVDTDTMSLLGGNALTTLNAQRDMDVIGCFITKQYSELSEKGSVDAILTYFHDACKSPKFCTQFEHAGFTEASFHPNPHLCDGKPGFEKFAQALKELEHHAGFGIAFHGTSTTNLPNIMLTGLDPSKRKGQAYGPGEYFSKDPAISISYCRGGLEMAVFVVVLPSTLTAPPNNKKNNKPNDNSQLHPSYSSLNSSGTPRPQATTHVVPPDFLVVANNSHQLPLGTMKFQSVNQEVLRVSQEKRRRFQELSKQVFDKCCIAEEGRVKSQIMTYIINDKIDLASELYQRQERFLKQSSKQEIAWYVLQRCEKGLFEYLFPNLPNPMKLSELEKGNVPSVDWAIQVETEAIRELEIARQALAG